MVTAIEWIIAIVALVAMAYSAYVGWTGGAAEVGKLIGGITLVTILTYAMQTRFGELSLSISTFYWFAGPALLLIGITLIGRGVRAHLDDRRMAKIEKEEAETVHHAAMR